MSTPLIFHFPPRWTHASSTVRPFCLVVGATGAIGEAVACDFAALGFSIVAAARDSSEGALAAVRDRLLRVTVDANNANAWHGLAPRQVLTLRIDLESGVPELQQAFGSVLSVCGHALECAVLCAGSVQPALLLGEPAATARQLTRDLHVDVVATAVLLQMCGSAMAQRGGGTMVLVSSTAGINSFSTGGVAIAGGAAAKQAMAEAALEELRGRGVRVSTVFAELVDSPQADHQQRHNANVAGAGPDLLQPSDVSRAVVFCAGLRSVAHCIVLRPHYNPFRTTKLFANHLAESKLPAAPPALVLKRANGRPAAIVTGASQGIGLACAERLAREGYDVALMARSADTLEQACASCRVAARSPDALMKAFVCDVGDRAQFQSAMSSALAWLGRCDVLVANAGTNRRRTALSADPAVWLSVLDTNLGHAVAATALVLPFMVHQKGGTIAFVSSVGGGARGTLVMADPGIAAYAASKSALVGFCSSVFEDCRDHNIKITQLALGLVSTPLGRKSMGGIERKIAPEAMIQQEECGDQLMFACNASPTCVPTMIGVASLTPPNRSYVDPKTLKRADDRALRTPLRAKL